MTLQIKAEVLLNNSNWEKKLTQTQKQVAGFGKSMKTVANGVKAAWAGVGLLAFGAVTDAIMDMTKAAAEDTKSTALLNKQLDNSWKATTKTKKEMADYVDQVSNLTGIVDDKLRPALSKIVTVTKNTTEAQKAFNMVLDISAGTGKDVNVVAVAYQKYLNGWDGALNKLVPGLKDVNDQMGFMEKRYGGMAAIAGKNDPFARITVVMDNFKEKLGMSFLPVINKFADWLASGESQKALDDIAQKVQKFGEWFTSPEGQEAFKGWMKDLKALIKLAGDFLGLVAQVADLLGSTGKRQSNTGTGNLNATNIMTGTRIKAITPDNKAGWTSVGKEIGNIVMNVTVNGVTNASQVVTELQKLAQKKGIPLSKLLK